jgi:hypothetical protein
MQAAACSLAHVAILALRWAFLFCFCFSAHDGLAAEIMQAKPLAVSQSQAKIEVHSALIFALKGASEEWIDLANLDAYFRDVFSRLPSEVTVYPSENYCYFADLIQGREIWGNIRLPAGDRDRGILSFAYEEQLDSLTGNASPITGAKYLTQADGINIRGIDPYTYSVDVDGRTVTFHLHKLLQEVPRLFSLRTNEVFIERTFDESGLQFFLLFNTRRNYFFWVLNEEEAVPEVLDKIGDDILIGSHTGFVFWRDAKQNGRKVLCMVSKKSVLRNDPFDGPFDQLADNDVRTAKIGEWMERAFPRLKGRIDEYGYYKNAQQPSRVALTCYGMYDRAAEVNAFILMAKECSDPYECISKSGVMGLLEPSE